MKLLASTILAALSTQIKAHGDYRQNAIYLEKNFNWGNMYNSIQQALDAGYNRFYVGFYMSVHGCQGACPDWANLSTEQKQNVKDLLAQYDASLYLSVGGPGEFYENCINSNCGANYGAEAGAFAAQNLFDGVEVALKLAGEATVPSPYADNGSFISMAKDIVTNIRSSGNYGLKQVAISSNAPYFSPDFVNGVADYALSTLCLNKNNQQTWAAYDCNLVMFNEDNNYMTYDDIFIKNTFVDPIFGQFGKGSSVQEIMNLGMDPYAVSVIKPVSEGESSVRNGFVPSEDLGTWGCWAHNTYAFQGGFIGWTWNSSSDVEMNKVLAFGNNTQSCD